MLRRGCNVALGTDGPASNNSLDMLEEARLCALMHKLHQRDPEVLPGTRLHPGDAAGRGPWASTGVGRWRRGWPRLIVLTGGSRTSRRCTDLWRP